MLEKHVKKKPISKYIDKCIIFLNHFGINLIVLSITSESIRIAWSMSAIAAPVGLTTLFITSFFKLGNRFVKLFFEYDRKLKNYTWKDIMLAKSK